MANRTEKFVEAKFLHEVDPKDGFSVKECRNDRERRVLEFLHRAPRQALVGNLDSGEYNIWGPRRG